MCRLGFAAAWRSFRRGRDTRRAAHTVPPGLTSSGCALNCSTYTVTGAATRWARSTSNRAGVPSGLAFNGSPYFARALFEVTSGGVFWIVAVGPERWTMRGLGIDTSGGCFRRPGFHPTFARFLAISEQRSPFWRDWTIKNRARHRYRGSKAVIQFTIGQQSGIGGFGGHAPGEARGC